jgi:hypothetical protein
LLKKLGLCFERWLLIVRMGFLWVLPVFVVRLSFFRDVNVADVEQF